MGATQALRQQRLPRSILRPVVEQHVRVAQPHNMWSTIGQPVLVKTTSRAGASNMTKIGQTAMGTTVTDWVRGRRLERCRNDLLDPRYARTSIGAIPARWGLSVSIGDPLLVDRSAGRGEHGVGAELSRCCAVDGLEQS
jgi:hypothetical protein